MLLDLDRTGSALTRDTGIFLGQRSVCSDLAPDTGQLRWRLFCNITTVSSSRSIEAVRERERESKQPSFQHDRAGSGGLSDAIMPSMPSAHVPRVMKRGVVGR